MKLRISENIKNLRKDKNISQETFAEILGVTCQSVSRWENEICYPDIELIPIIADYFNVSVDYLLGVDKTLEEKEVNKYLSEFQLEISKGNIEKCINIARKGVAQHPNNYKLLNKLMYALFVSADDTGNISNWKENKEKYDEEIVSLGNRIMKHCDDVDIKYEAITRLAFHHCEMGRKKIGKEIYNNIPSMNVSREVNLWWSLEEDEKLPFIRHYIKESYNQLNCALGLLVNERLISPSESIEVQKIRFTIDELIEGKDSGLYSFYKAATRFKLAKLYATVDDTDNMYKYLKEAVQFAKDHDNRPESWKTNSLCIGEVINYKIDFETADTRSLSDIMKNEWLLISEFDKYRNDTAFKKLFLELQ